MTDLAFEALAEVCGVDWTGEITKNERGRLNQALGQLRAIYRDDVALPMMIHERAAAYRVAFVDMPLTPQALLNHWSTVLELAEAARAREKKEARAKQKVTNAHSTRPCDVCQGDRVVIVGENNQGSDVAIRCWGCSGGTMPTGWVAA